MGFDGSEMAKYYEPSICTVRQPKGEIARQTVKVLIDLMNGSKKNRHIVFPTEIVTGGSCASPNQV